MIGYRSVSLPMLRVSTFFAPRVPSVIPSRVNWQPIRTKVILPRSHPLEYFRRDWDPTNPKMPKIYHPQPQILQDGSTGPLYYKITLIRSLIGLEWSRRLTAGILFKCYPTDAHCRPKKVRPKISTKTVVFREASPAVAKLILELKELVQVENIWTEEQYREEARPLIGKKARTLEEQCDHIGFRILGNLGDKPLYENVPQKGQL